MIKTPRDFMDALPNETGKGGAVKKDTFHACHRTWNILYFRKLNKLVSRINNRLDDEYDQKILRVEYSFDMNCWPFTLIKFNIAIRYDVEHKNGALRDFLKVVCNEKKPVSESSYPSAPPSPTLPRPPAKPPRSGGGY